MRALVSIVVPCWNIARYLDETFASVAALTCGDFEVLAIDDGSTDGTCDIIERWAAKDRRFRVIRQVGNQGVVAARNLGLAQAQGDYVAMLDGDDVWSADALEHRLLLARRFAGADVISTDFTWFGDDVEGCDIGRVMLGPRGRLAFADAYASGEPVLLVDAFARVATIHFAWVGATLVRRAAMRAVGDFDAAFEGPEDTLLWLKLANAGAFVFSPRITAHYRQRAESIVGSLTVPKEFEYLKVLERVGSKIEFARHRETIDSLSAACHHACAVRFRGERAWGRAVGHSAASVRLRPSSGRHWRELFASVIGAAGFARASTGPARSH